MKVADVISHLESVAPREHQEGYDNAGLLTGSFDQDVTGILCCLDVTEAILQEAMDKGCNCIVAHHPIIFRGLKKLTGSTHVERTVAMAIRHDISIYAIHTNLDNVIHGVNSTIADAIGIIDRQVLEPKQQVLQKLVTYVPVSQAERVRSAMFQAGAGNIGDYSECSFAVLGEGTFKAGHGTSPYVGKAGERHSEQEFRIETVFPAYLQAGVVRALISSHPYEEPAYDLFTLQNNHSGVGSGLIGILPKALSPEAVLSLLSHKFNIPAIRYSNGKQGEIRTIAVCGGAGSFLISKALRAGADAFISSDIKYHDFFEGEGQMMICDIGHFESEQFTIELLHDLLVEKFPTFAVLKTTIKTSPVQYFVG